MHNKPVLLHNLVRLHNPDIVVDTETWLSSNVTAGELFEREYVAPS